MICGIHMLLQINTKILLFSIILFSCKKPDGADLPKQYNDKIEIKKIKDITEDQNHVVNNLLNQFNYITKKFKEES